MMTLDTISILIGWTILFTSLVSVVMIGIVLGFYLAVTLFSVDAE